MSGSTAIPLMTQANTNASVVSQTGASGNTVSPHTVASQPLQTNANASVASQTGASENTVSPHTVAPQPLQANANASQTGASGNTVSPHTVAPQPLQTNASVSQSGAMNSLQTSENYCGSCGKDYNNSQSDFWIGCDLCECWFCNSCEGLSSEPTTEYYMCLKCRE